MAVNKKNSRKKCNKKKNTCIVLENNKLLDNKNLVKDTDDIVDDENGSLDEKKLEKKDNALKDKRNIISDEDIININTNDDVLSVTSSIKKKNKYVGIFSFLLIIFTVGLIMMFFPRIKLLGENDIIITYNDSYEEPGYNVYFFNKDISDKVKIINNVDDGVVGKYEVVYYLDLFGVRLKKTRYVNIVDEDAPEIEVNSDILDVCPNQEVPDFEYRAIDEYDGDITSKVDKVYEEDRIILNVRDLSNNFTSKTVMINRGDKVSPVIKLKGSSVMVINYGSRYYEPGYEVSDNCSNDLNDKVIISGEVGKNVGTYILNYSVSDESGNVSSVSRKVIVIKKTLDNGVINNGTIYLTFDDGPNQGTTNKILDILKEKGIKATFFITCSGPDSLIKRMYDEGHTVALHTASHNYGYIYSSIDNYFSDLKKVSDRVQRITGTNSKIIRFPGGSSNTISRNYKKGIMTELTNLVLNDGYRYFDWNVDAMDASTARNSSDVYYNVVSNLSINRSNVVLMHDTKMITVNGLRDIIEFGIENGYKFSAIDMNTYMIRHSVNN